MKTIVAGKTFYFELVKKYTIFLRFVEIYLPFIINRYEKENQ